MDKKRALYEFKEIKKYSDTVKIRLAAEEWDAHWKILISTILSAQTRDEVTIAICEKLFEKYNSIEKLGKARLSDIEKMISSINYYKTKAKNIKKTSEIVTKNGLSYKEEDLLELPGVGRKVANVFLSETGKKDAIAVDTHLFRISRRMGWSEGKTPEKVEYDLQQLFEKKLWNSLNPVLVRFGKEYGRSKTREEEILSSIKEN